MGHGRDGTSFSPRHAGGGDEVVRQAPEVTVGQPVTRAVRPFVDFTGTTRAIESAEIRARVGGVLEQQLFEASEIVERDIRAVRD